MPFDDWAASHSEVDGFQTAPGVFSADRVDPGSACLVSALPEDLPARVADFGAGWGYLSHAILTRASVRELHLVEAEHDAMECAKQNVIDPRAQFHWADATIWTPPDLLDSVVMNPPFHQSRASDPGLGQSFIASAARVLKPRGRVWCVANRHLPYEAAAAHYFQQVTEIAGDNRFKVLLMEKPRRVGR